MTNAIEITTDTAADSKAIEVVTLYTAGLITRDESRALLEIDQRLADIETEALTDAEDIVAKLILIQSEINDRITGKKWGLEEEFKPKYTSVTI